MSGPFLNVGAWRTTVTANDSTALEEVDILRFEAGKVYRYVRAGASAAISAGQAVNYVSAAGVTAGTVATVAAITTAASRAINGICETALSTSYYGWMTVYGTATALVDTGAVAGNALVAATTAGALATPVTIGLTVTGAVNSSKVIDALITGVNTGSLVFVHCL